MNAPIFPNETMAHILDFAVENMADERNTRDTTDFEEEILELCKVSRLYRTVLLPVLFRHVDLHSFRRGLRFLDTIAHPQSPIASGIFTIQICVYLDDDPEFADHAAAFRLAWRTIVPRLVRLSTLVVAFRPEDAEFPNHFFDVYRPHQLPNLRKLAFFSHMRGDAAFSVSTGGGESDHDGGEDASIDDDEEEEEDDASVDDDEKDEDDDTDSEDEPPAFWDIDNCSAWAAVLCDDRLNHLHHIIFSLPQPAFWPPTYRRLHQLVASWLPSVSAASSLRSFVLHSGYRDETEEVSNYRDDHLDPVFDDLFTREKKLEYIKTHLDLVPEQLIDGPDSSMYGRNDPGDLGIPAVIFERSVINDVSVWELMTRWDDAYCGLGEHLLFEHFRTTDAWMWPLRRCGRLVSGEAVVKKEVVGWCRFRSIISDVEFAR
ncbi:hypothetical protein R3P38DRAFT_3206419 [Favolaschia claudopus]|uniref:Uncharacterized protein n=1 Tax=Favolaschia claudopus TaxID=2862362 RepID=A0AAW0ALV5_9AGAR